MELHGAVDERHRLSTVQGRTGREGGGAVREVRPQRTQKDSLFSSHKKVESEATCTAESAKVSKPCPGGA